MTNHIDNRQQIIQSLREELVGPCPRGEEIDCSSAVHFEEPKQSYGPWIQKGSGEEILLRDRPCKRYGVAVLYPTNTEAADETDEDDTAAEDDPTPGTETVLTDAAVTDLAEIEDRKGGRNEQREDNDLDLSGANTYRPSTMGISFLAEIPEDGVLEVTVTGGRYNTKTVRVGESERTWWLRSSVKLRAVFNAESLLSDKTTLSPDETDSENLEGFQLSCEVISRPRHDEPRQRLLTVCVINRQEAEDAPDPFCLFQSHFTARIRSKQKGQCIRPYPGTAHDQLDEEEQSHELLYRNVPTFAVGHGCAADWETNESRENAGSVSAECLPSHELPSFTPDIHRPDGSTLDVAMAPLAGLDASDDGMTSLEDVVSAYKTWITQQRSRISSELPAHCQPAATRHMDACEACAVRMEKGLSYLQDDVQALRAFTLANRAILIQQLRTSSRDLRAATYDPASRRLVFSETFTPLDTSAIPKQRGKWRAFQIAFLLMSVQSTVENSDADRDRVELIWFPTGGGKTEAYSALAAFAMFIRRLRNQDDCGVHVLMRYTLRLLTAQQFQRASAMICAMEYIRRKNDAELGQHEFSIGIWVGGDNTPNTKQNARASLRKLKKEDKWEQNKFLVTRCPWCRAQIGPLKHTPRRPKNAPVVFGYEESEGTVALCCSDPLCDFGNGLPVYVIDQDIYEKRPTMVIGTVDKFAMLAWKADARSLFGLACDGSRNASPPGLIIQDELHLISGPLGSLYGLYETVIEDLCTDQRVEPHAKPKIVCSTATIRKYDDQVQALYDRDSVTLFPPPGLDAADSFFAAYAKDADGQLSPGRMYVGVHGPSLGSLQTAQVRTFSSLLQAPVLFDKPARDPWWTLLSFFNSLRELGNSLSLFQTDIPNYFKVLRSRHGLDWPDIRRFGAIRELTGRLRDDEIPLAISELERTTEGAGRAIDVCLASNIIEVGIDIDRLSLMTVVGQPKTTAQYIQVTGRIGRQWRERPGIVVTIYSPSKPRDRSHFEKFRSYHERLYAEVEPTSVTPFSPPALDRALHAILVSFVRQNGNQDSIGRPVPYPGELIATLRKIVCDRVARIDSAELANVKKVFDKRASEWEHWERPRWAAWEKSKELTDDAPLLHPAGGYVSSRWKKITWPTLQSLRNVDAECQAEITTLYLTENDGDENA